MACRVLQSTAWLWAVAAGVGVSCHCCDRCHVCYCCYGCYSAWSSCTSPWSFPPTLFKDPLLTRFLATHAIRTCLPLSAQEALRRLPPEVIDARHQRIKRAQDLCLKKNTLPKEMQALQTPDESYYWVGFFPLRAGLSAAAVLSTLSCTTCR